MANPYLTSNDLIGFQQQSAASNPWIGVGGAINSWQPNYGNSSLGTSAATAFGKAFLGGFLQNYGANQVADQTRSIVDILPQLTADPYTTQAPEGVPQAAFQNMRGTAMLNQYKQNAFNEENKNQNINRLLTTILPDLIQRRKISASDAANILSSPDPAKALSSVSSSSAPTSQPVQELPTTKPAIDFGLKTLDQYENDRYRYLIENQNMPEIQAAARAGNARQELYRSNKSLITDRLGGLTEQLGELDKVITHGERGIAEAGTTGMPLGLQGVANLYENIASYWPGETEADRQLAGVEALRQANMRGIQANMFKGALSEKELALLQTIGMSDNKTEAENRYILDSAKAVREKLKDYQTFLNYYAENASASPYLAEELWKKYNQENPAIIEVDGKTIANPNRKSIFVYDFTGKSQPEDNQTLGDLTKGSKKLDKATYFQLRQQGLSKEQIMQVYGG